MTIEWGARFDCGPCDTCNPGCSRCADGKVPASLIVNFSGLVVQECSVDTDCDTVEETVTVFDPTSLNGDHTFSLIYLDGVYATGYDTGDMGLVDSGLIGGGIGGCVAVYEATFTGLGDMFLGIEGQCPDNQWADEDYWLRDVNMRMRIYIDSDLPTSDYDMWITTIIPSGGGPGFFEQLLTSVIQWDGDTDPWYCTVDGEWDNAGYDGILSQLSNGLFWSETDTSLEAGTQPQCVGVTIPEAGAGSDILSITASTDRVYEVP